LPGDSDRFDLCGNRVSGFHYDRSTFYIPPLTKGGEGGFAFRTGPCDSGVLNPPQSPFVKGGGEERGLSAILSFFFCVPKRRNKKMAPQPVLALRASLTSRRERDAEKLGLRPQTVPASFSAPVCEARQDKWGGEEKSHWHAAEHRRGCRKGDLHCLSAASLQSPGSIEEHRASRPRRDKRHGGPFFGSFLWASKEMNKLISRSGHVPAPRIPKKNLFYPAAPHTLCLTQALGDI
jgi:hypothetical protein